MLEKDYLKTLSERKKQTHVFKDFQHSGLVIAQMLGDEKHKALYIKLAKNIGKQTLMSIAKDVAERSEVSNRGAYFMELIKQNGLFDKIKSWPKKKKVKKSGQLKLRMKNRS